jgi:hypothetical protein
VLIQMSGGGRYLSKKKQKCALLVHILYKFKYSFDNLVIEMPPFMHNFFDPVRFSVELVYTLIVVILFFLVYQKTKDLFDLTKHEGIRSFRNAFLLFGLAYLARFVFHFLQLSRIVFDLEISRRFVFPASIVFTGYLSTVAIFYLTYSTIWQKISHRNFMIFSNMVALIISVIAFLSRSPFLLSLLQLVLLMFTLILSLRNKKHKKKSHVRALYLLISIFWLINLFLLEPRIRLPPGLDIEVKFVFQAISIIVFIALYNRVAKWTK